MAKAAARASSAAADAMNAESAAEETRVLKALLVYYDACGVDCALDAEPHNRFSESARPSKPAPAPIEAPALERRPQPVRIDSAAMRAPEELARAAEALAAAATDLEQLKASLAGFEGLAPTGGARHFFFASGAPAELMVMDFTPGEAEERSGAPFCGSEARLLEAMLKAIGASRDNAYLSYFAPWRFAGGQAPPPHVAAALAPFARRHVALARPKAVLLLGEFARLVLGVDEAPARLYGRRCAFPGAENEILVLVTPSLSSMLRTAALKRAAWRSLRNLSL
jgi:uracil-DNA glycosylase family 4